jgi:uncharacterized peroxidase-related enzyme
MPSADRAWIIMEGNRKSSTRLATLSPDHSPELADHFARQEQNVGYAANASLIMQRDPALAKAFWQLTAAVWRQDSKVDLGLKRLIAFVSSQTADCRYCMAHQVDRSLHLGVSEEKFKAIWDYATSPLYSDAERIALDVAAAASRVPNETNDEMFATLRRYWTEEQIVEIVGVIALFGFLNRWNTTMATPLENIPLEYGERMLRPHGWSPGRNAPRS